MKTLILSAVTTLSFFFCAVNTSYSDEWLQIETSVIGERFYIDLESMQVSGPIVTFWTKNIDRKQEETRIRYSINCEKQTGAIRDIIIYKLDGNILKSYSCKDNELQWMKIAPGSFMDEFKKNVCKKS
ncbi:MAG TPA: surface-adhesin E family protein [Thermodesulfovibrionales bacterium]|nr:surface-adhesin E family protein [Thermodesulfovibrionales bacterium]